MLAHETDAYTLYMPPDWRSTASLVVKSHASNWQKSLSRHLEERCIQRLEFNVPFYAPPAEDQLALFAEAIRGHSTLRDLDVSYSYLDAPIMLAFADNPTLTALDIRHVALAERTMQELAHILLAPASQVQCLRLTFDADCLDPLAALISHPDCKLRELYVSLMHPGYSPSSRVLQCALKQNYVLRKVTGIYGADGIVSANTAVALVRQARCHAGALAFLACRRRSQLVARSATRDVVRIIGQMIWAQKLAAQWDGPSESGADERKKRARK